MECNTQTVAVTLSPPIELDRHANALQIMFRIYEFHIESKRNI